MRSIHLLVVTGLVGCAGVANGPRGETRAKHAGDVPLVFTNATPQTMCGLFMTTPGNGKLGDNWLPAAGLRSGQSLELRVRRGTYRATWSTCQQRGQPYYAGTLTADTAFAVDEATQLFVFVADRVAPTSRAPVLAHHHVIKFPGQQVRTIEEQLALAARAPAKAITTTREASDAGPDTAPRTEHVDLSAFVDRRARVRRPARKRMKASLRRYHDVAKARAGYVER